MNADDVTIKGQQYEPSDSLKLNGPPGTGKTTQLLERLTSLLDDGVSVRDVTFVTYRTEMAAEFLRRLHDSGYIEEKEAEKPYKHDPRHFGTLHGVCNRITSDAAVVTDSDRRDFIFQEYKATYDTSSPGDSIGSLLFDAYDWCVENKQHQFLRAPNYKEIKDRAISPPSFSEFDEAWRSYKQEGNDDGKPLMDFAGMLREVDDRGLRPNGDVLIVDEYHDMTPIMASICERWMESFDTVIVGGDPLQCIPEGELVQTPDGERPIESLKVGDRVETAIGGHDTAPVEIEATHSKDTQEPVATFKTESGKTIRCTLDHELFARPPHQRQSDGGYHFVYIMESGQQDYRIGVTSMPRHRLNAEAGAARMMLLGAWEREKDALRHENKWCYKYGLPQDPFMARGGLSQSDIDDIYDSLDTRSGFEQACSDLHIDPDRWHLYSQSAGSKDADLGRPGERLVIRFKMGRSKSRQSGALPYVYHKLCVETSNPDAIEVLRSHGLSETSAKSGRRFRKQSKDYGAMRRLAHRLSKELSDTGLVAHVEEKASYASFDGDRANRTSGLPVVGASQVTEGMYVPVLSDGSVRYEKVVSKEVTEESTTVYDLTVPPTHNYFVGGVAVHNSIYTYKGADPSFFTGLDLPEVVLDRTYRVPSHIWEYAQSVIEHNPPQIQPDAEGGEVRAVVGEPHKVYTKYGDGSVMYLARTQSQLYDIANDLRKAGVIFRSQEGIGGWNNSSTLLGLYNALQKIRNARPVDNVNPETGQTGMTRYGDGDVESNVRLPETVTLEPNEAVKLVSYTPAGYFSDTKKDMKSYATGAQNVTGTDLLQRVEPSFWADLTRGGQSVDNLLTYDAKDTLRAALERNSRPYPAIEAANVPDVLTIHAAKGKEADTVALYDGIPGAVLRSIRKGEREMEAESRVWYVGVTRAAERLLVFRDQWDYVDQYLPATP